MNPVAIKKLIGFRELVICLLLGALYAMHKGQDAAWDLKNYHLYNAWSFLHGRLSSDLAPAGLQGFFNPLLDVPYFWLGTGPLQHLPRLLSALQGLCYGGVVFILLRVALRLAQIRERPFGISDVLAVGIGATGTMLASQTGSSTNEVPLALLVLLGFYVLLPFCARALPTRPMRRVMLAGLLCGLAAGLKPTAVIFTPALALALWLAPGTGATAWRLSVVFVLAAIGAFLLAYGWWGWMLVQLTGDPVFPMFNQVFHSPWVPSSANTDRQFMPRSLAQWLLYPFFWIQKNGYQGGNTFADARYAIAMVAVIWLAVSSRRGRRRHAAGACAVRFMLVFAVVSYALWLALYSILRYAIPIEALTGLIVLVALQELATYFRYRHTSSRWIVWTMAGIALVLAGCTRYPDWGHAPYASVVFDVRPPAIESGSTVVVLGQPNAYVIPFLRDAQTLDVVGITWLTADAGGYRLAALTQQRIRSHEGPIYAITRDTNTAEQLQFQRILPGARLVDCQPVISAMERTRRGTDLSQGLRVCEVLRQ